MLQRVALGQIRFNVPGLAADARGVVGGRQLVVRFSTLDRLVSFFRALSAEQSLDDLGPGLRVVHVRAGAGSREALVVLPSGSTHLGDLIARAARLAGGQAFTGTGRHFVQYRDRRAPLGYDAITVSQEEGELVLYGAEQTVAYRVENELGLDTLLLRLSLQRRHGPSAAPPEHGPLFLTARRGLGPLVAEHLHRSQRFTAAPREPRSGERASVGASPSAVAPSPSVVLRASAALCDSSDESAFRSDAGFWLFRLEGVPRRMLALLAGTPGLELFAPVTENAAVAVGYRHPIHLDACRGLFAPDRFFLFSPGPAPVMTIAPAPSFVPIEDLVRIDSALPRAPSPAEATPRDRPELVVPLELEPSPDPTRRAYATLVPWEQVDWLRRLCYALPTTALRGYRVAALERGLLVVSAGALEGFPFGTLLDLAAPDVLVPIGARLRPAISPELLAERTGALGGAMVVFPALGERPFRIPGSALEPLERRTVAELAPMRPSGRDRAVVARPKEQPIEIQNDRMGPMPLWGVDR